MLCSLAAAAALTLVPAAASAADGAFERAWGRNVDSVNPSTGFEICTVAANCQPGGSTGLGGEFSGPTGIASDAAGDVYVADRDNARIQKFDSQGNFVLAFGK